MRNFEYYSKWMLLASMMLIMAACGADRNAQVASATQDSISRLSRVVRQFDYSDTSAIHSREVMAQNIQAISTALSQSDSIEASTALSSLFHQLRSDEKALSLTATLLDELLYNPNSPFRSEDAYIMFLRALLREDSIPDHIRQREIYNLERVLKNRPGDLAANFRYIDTRGYEASLYSFRAEKTLLIMYDVDCPHCKEIITAFAQADNLNEAIMRGEIAVLAIYTEGDRLKWEASLKAMPANWHIGYDASAIVDNELYDLPAMPTIYLLDSEKRVMAKDLNPAAIISSGNQQAH